MGSYAKSNLSDGVLPRKGTNPKIIAIGDAIAKRRKNDLRSLFGSSISNASQKKEIVLSESESEAVEITSETNTPYVVAKWVEPHTSCIIRGVGRDRSIRAIIYPGKKKRRQFFYSAGKLIRVETTESESADSKFETKVVYSFDPFSNRWAMIYDGIVGKLDGKIELSENGVLKIGLDNSGTCRAEYPDGTTKLIDNCCEGKTKRLSVPEMEFLNVVSHDLRSPLMSVQGLLTLLASGALGNLSEKAIHRIEGVELEIERLIRLVNDLLEAGLLNNHKQNLVFEDVPVSELFDATVFALQGIADQKDINIEFENTDLSISVNVDSFIRVMVNLVANAVKYSPSGETVKLNAVQEDQMVIINVRDFGKGISESDFERIFNSFQCGSESDRQQNGGIGLGLAICKSIVEAHNGFIGLDSKPQEGTNFWIRIPA